MEVATWDEPSPYAPIQPVKTSKQQLPIGNSWQVNWSELSIEKELGKGAYGKVYAATQSSADLALKVIQTRMMTEGERAATIEQELLLTTLSLKHRHIMDVWDTHLKFDTILVLIMPLMQWTLYDLMREKGDDCVLDYVSNVVAYTQQLLSGLSYLHRNRVLHRDIKPQNVLVDKTFKRLVLADFGFAVQLNKDHDPKTTDHRGTLWYMAPEVLTCQSYSYPSDCWSMGVTIYEMMIRECWWVELKINELPQDIAEDQFLNNLENEDMDDLLDLPKELIPMGALQLVKGLLKFNPDKRSKADEDFRFLSAPY